MTATAELLDLDRRSRESVPSRRSRMSRDWISLSGRLAAGEKAMDDEDKARVVVELATLTVIVVEIDADA